MIIQGDPRLNRFVLQALIENECQFFVSFKEKREIRVAFRKGVWLVMDNNGNFIELNDSPALVATNNNLLKGLVEQRLDALSKKSYPKPWREIPSMIIADTIHVWIHSLELITSIDVTQAGRDGWFTSFNE